MLSPANSASHAGQVSPAAEDPVQEQGWWVQGRLGEAGEEGASEDVWGGASGAAGDCGAVADEDGQETLWTATHSPRYGCIHTWLCMIRGSVQG